VIVLAIDTATLVCSTALLSEEKLLAEYTLNIKKTHSQRLMPLIDRMLRDSEVAKEKIDAIAVARGPGSFTGVRIGVATARALAQGLGVPAVGVNTLEALAEAVPAEDSLVCPLLDARREQVYTALYRRGKNWSEPLIEPCALAVEELAATLKRYGERIYFLGDGLTAYSGILRSWLKDSFQPLIPPLVLNRASLVARCGLNRLQKKGAPPLEQLLPLYIRAPETVRRLPEQEQRKFLEQVGDREELKRAESEGGQNTP
jgi:tRNA threonylcarbamoyladenosine biosynthesis protein TsaB